MGFEGFLESDVAEALLPDEVEPDPIRRRQLLRAEREDVRPPKGGHRIEGES